MNRNDTKKLLAKRFRRSGLMVQSGASKLLLSYVFHTDMTNPKETLDEDLILQRIDTIMPLIKASDSSTLLSEEVVANIITDLGEQQHENVLDIVQDSFPDPIKSVMIQSAFEVPKFRFSALRKLFLPDPSTTTPTRSIYASPETKLSLLRDRYDILHQRLLRNPIFSPPIIQDKSLQDNYCRLTPISGLPRTSCSSGNTLLCVFGLIRQLSDNLFGLEDTSGVVPVSLSSTKTTDGLFTVGSFVIAEGFIRECTDEETALGMGIGGGGVLFQVETMGFPPPETRKETLSSVPELHIAPPYPTQ